MTIRAKWIALTAAAFLVPPVAAQAQQPYHWSGFYVGVNYGTALGQSNTRSKGPIPGVSAPGLSHDISRSGGSFGAQIGVNWQFAPNWLVGLEGDINYLHVNKTNLDWFDTISVGMQANWYGTARARFGYVTGPSLLYVTGGAAAVAVRHTFGGDASTGLAPTQSSELAHGYAIGGGIETKLSRNWSTRLEYIYIDADDHVFTASPYGAVDTAIFQNKFHIVRGGLNYRFADPSEAASASDAPFQVAARNWAGFYVGANVGSAMSVTHIDGIVGPKGQTDVNGHGLTGGLQAGYNVMLGPKWFAGIEGDVGYLALDRSFHDWADVYMFSQKADWYATVRGRAGLNTGAALLYVTGGAAAVNVTTGINNFSSLVSPGITRETALGWTLGAGTEVALNSRWSAKVESLHIDVGSREEATATGGGLPRVVEFQRAFQVFRFGLNYRFGADEVETARY